MSDDGLTSRSRDHLFSRDPQLRLGAIATLIGKASPTMPGASRQFLHELIYSIANDDGEQPAHWMWLRRYAPQGYIDAVVTGLEDP